MLTDVVDILYVAETVLLSRLLTPLERLILQQSWLGHSYAEMATGSGYESNYLKEVGSDLWHDLSSAIGVRVTKRICKLSSISIFLISQMSVQIGQMSLRIS